MFSGWIEGQILEKRKHLKLQLFWLWGQGINACHEPGLQDLTQPGRLTASLSHLSPLNNWFPWFIENQVKEVIAKFKGISASPQNSILTCNNRKIQFLIWSIQIEFFCWTNLLIHTWTNINSAPMIGMFSWGNHKSLRVITKEPMENSCKGNHK